jgi:hypothetical protein
VAEWPCCHDPLRSSPAGKAAIPLGQITLPVTFRTLINYRTEFIHFEVADFETSYHAILERPTLVKFMAIPHYPYLWGDLKRAFDCDIQAIQITVKAQAANGREEITTVAATDEPERTRDPN